MAYKCTHITSTRHTGRVTWTVTARTLGHGSRNVRTLYIRTHLALNDALVRLAGAVNLVDNSVQVVKEVGPVARLLVLLPRRWPALHSRPWATLARRHHTRLLIQSSTACGTKLGAIRKRAYTMSISFHCAIVAPSAFSSFVCYARHFYIYKWQCSGCIWRWYGRHTTSSHARCVQVHSCKRML